MTWKTRVGGSTLLLSRIQILGVCTDLRCKYREASSAVCYGGQYQGWNQSRQKPILRPTSSLGPKVSYLTLSLICQLNQELLSSHRAPLWPALWSKFNIHRLAIPYGASITLTLAIRLHARLPVRGRAYSIWPIRNRTGLQAAEHLILQKKIKVHRSKNVFSNRTHNTDYYYYIITINLDY